MTVVWTNRKQHCLCILQKHNSVHGTGIPLQVYLCAEPDLTRFRRVRQTNLLERFEKSPERFVPSGLFFALERSFTIWISTFFDPFNPSNINALDGF